MTKPLTWTLPKGVAADKSMNKFARMRHYRNTCNIIIGGVRVYPSLQTLKMIIEAYDLVGAELCVEEGGYYVYGDQAGSPESGEGGTSLKGDIR